METTAIKPTSEQEQKLTKWASEPELRQLKSEFMACEHTHGALVSNINEWAKLHKGDLPPEMKADKTRSQAQPKLVRRQAEWRYTALSEPMLSSSRLFTIKPVTGEDVDGALQNELLLNHQFRTKMNRVWFIDQYIRSAVDEGTAALRVGWEQEIKTIKRSVPIYDYFAVESEEESQLIQQALDERKKDPTTFELRAPPSLKASVKYFDETQELVISIDTKERQEIEEKQIVKNHPTVEVIDPRNLRIDPSCSGDVSKAQFMVYSYETNRAALLKDRERLGYKNLDAIDWSAVGPLQTEYHHAQGRDSGFQFDDKARRRIVVHEYWGNYDIHKTGQLVPIVASWIGDTLIRMTENPFPDGKPPFVIVPYLPKKRDIHGESDAALLEDQQQNIGALMRGMIDILGRSAAGQTGVAQGTMDAVNWRRFQKGQDYQFNPNQPVANAIHHHTYPEISASAVNLMMILNNDAEAISGTKSFSEGISGSAYGKVAAGARAALDAAAKREMGILRRLVMGLNEVAMKIIAMNQVFLSEKEIIRVTNNTPLMLNREEGETDEKFVTINRVELAGNYDVEIDIATAEVDEAQSQDLGFMLQTLGPKVEWPIIKMILGEIARLKRLPGLEKAIREYEPQPDPVEQKMKELELAKLEAEIAEIQANTEESRAKARKAIAEAEDTDLSTVERGSGVEHKRALQTATAQAEGNRDLEITKSLTKPTKEGEKGGDLEAAIGFNELTRNQDKAAPTVDTEVPQQAQSFDPQGFAGPMPLNV